MARGSVKESRTRVRCEEGQQDDPCLLREEVRPLRERGLDCEGPALLRDGEEGAEVYTGQDQEFAPGMMNMKEKLDDTKKGCQCCAPGCAQISHKFHQCPG